MSRTFRRPDILLTRGFNSYSWRDRHHITYDDLYHNGNGHSGCPIYRPMTPHEVNRMNLFLYGDSKRNAYGPSRRYRHYREEELRSFNRKEFIRWKQRCDYEPMFSATPKSCLWDWS